MALSVSQPELAWWVSLISTVCRTACDMSHTTTVSCKCQPKRKAYTSETRTGVLVMELSGGMPVQETSLGDTVLILAAGLMKLFCPRIAPVSASMANRLPRWVAI